MVLLKPNQNINKLPSTRRREFHYIYVHLQKESTLKHLYT